MRGYDPMRTKADKGREGLIFTIFLQTSFMDDPLLYTMLISIFLSFCFPLLTGIFMNKVNINTAIV